MADIQATPRRTRFNPALYRPEAPKLVSANVTDKHGNAITFTFRKAGPLDQLAIGDLAQKMIARYVDFSMRSVVPHKNDAPPIPFQSVNDQPVVITEMTCNSIATFVVLQYEPGDYDLMTFEEYVTMFALDPELATSLVSRLGELMDEEDDEEGKSSEALTKG